MNESKQSIIAVAGPTASGKSALAMHLCRRFCGELVSCDSMQIYRRMDIGTAKPTYAERAEVMHHLIDICEPNEEFSVAAFAEKASLAIRDIAKRGKTPILCGGTGLYLDSLLNGVRFGELEKDEAYRASLCRFAEENGADALHALLREKDPEAAAAIHPNNQKRVIRALEICRLSGMTKTEWDRAALAKEAPFSSTVLALDYRDRERLYERIDRRVDQMLAMGLEAEARTLYKDGLLRADTTAGGAIGYKEWIDCFEGRCTPFETAQRIKTATRHYAKRQLTWLRRNENVIWLYPDAYADSDALFAAAEELVQGRL